MKWIKASFLDHWSTSNASEGQLPELVRDLVLASVDDRTKISEIRFPIGDMARTPGYDGKLGASISHSFVPDGDSVWEIKTSKDYEGEANKDFTKRSENPKGIDKSTTTYVFVTSKVWRKPLKTKEQWIEEKKKEDPSWKDIQVIDAIDLEQWLELCPATSANFAKRVGVSPLSGAKGIDEFWNVFVNRYKPTLNEATLLTSRNDQATNVVNELLDGYSIQRIQADSVDEVIAFVIAAIFSSGSDSYRFLKSRILILENIDAVNHFSYYRGMVFIITPNVASNCGHLAQNNSLILPKGKKDMRRDSVALVRPTSFELAESLKELGLSEDEAMRASKESGGSITILARRRPSVDSNPPEWVQNHGATMVPALLAGSWDDSNDNDKSILADLSTADKYSDYQEEIIGVLNADDSPIEREASIWKIIAPVDTFVNIGGFISENHFERLKQVAITVFSEMNPNIVDQQSNETDTSSFFKKTTKYSRWLRDGLATTLLQIAALHEEIDLKISSTSSQKFVDEIIRNLPGLKNDPRVIISLNSELPYLMEAAPDPLLEALEHMLEGIPEKVQEIFNESDDMFSHSYHTELLWALECLAWNPKYIKRVCLILTKLSQIDPGGKTINRPINSLTEIFLLWHPGTNANLLQRFSVIDEIIKFDSNTAWELVANLLPSFHGVSHGSNKPIYRESGANNRERITYELLWQSHEKVFNRAIKLTEGNHNRWKDILEALAKVKPDLRKTTISAFKKAIEHFSKENKEDFWNFLRDFLSRHKSYPEAEWSLTGDNLKAIEELYQQLTPQNNLERFKFLFDEHTPRLPDLISSYDPEAIKKERLKAIKNIYSSEGIDGVIDFAGRLKNTQSLVSAFLDHVNDMSVFKEIIHKSHGASENLTRFNHELSSNIKYKYSTDEWNNIILDLIEKNNWSDDLITELILSWPNVKETWDFVSTLGQGITDRYWKNKSAWISKDMNTADIEFSAKKYVENNRALSAVKTVHENIADIDLDLVVKILKNAITEINSLKSPNNMLSYYFEKIFDALASRSDISENDLAMLEYAYFPVLERKKNNLTIHKMLAKDPAFYISLIKDAFKARNSEKSLVTIENQRKAEAAYRLLDSFKIIPGHTENEINLEILHSWTKEVLKLAIKNDREAITQQHIGKLLAHAPNDPDDEGWPHKSIRDFIEKTGSDQIEKGLKFERFNMRGAYIKGIFEGGQQERELAKKYREWAQISKRWFRTNEMLEKIAERWEAHAKEEDSQARLDRLKS